MNRITQKDLQNIVDRINLTACMPLKPWTDNKANIGNYHLDWAYGGVKLVRHVNEGGGIKVITMGGYGTKRELYYQMQAYLRGLEDCIRGQADHDAAINKAIA